MLLKLCLSVVSYTFIGASILYHCMMKAIKFRLCLIKFKCYTFCGKTRVMNYFIIYFINVIVISYIVLLYIIKFKCYIICDNIRIMNYFTSKVIGWCFTAI